VSRDDPFPAKPDPAGVQYAAEKMKVYPGHMLVVGDYIFDLDAGRAAGSPTVWIDSRGEHDFRHAADHSITCLSELESIVFGE
jgi:phosphoglycolate phosphatase-like HAD superfamily hydrolase